MASTRDGRVVASRYLPVSALIEILASAVYRWTMIPAELAFQGGVEALTVLNSIIKLAHTARERGKENGLQIADVMKVLPAEAFHLAGELENRATQLEQSLKETGGDLSKTVDELQQETWIYQRSRYNLLKHFNANVQAICTQLEILADDAVAIAQCSHEEELLALSYQQAREQKQQIDRRCGDANLPVGERLEFLIDQARRFRAELGTI